MCEERNPETVEQTAPHYDEAQVNFVLDQLRSEQNLSMGIVAGGIAAAVGAGLWAAITAVTGFQIGWMAVGVGFLVGLAVRHFGKGIDKAFGIAGAVLALIGCLAGNLFAICAVIASQEEMAFLEVVSQEADFSKNAVDGWIDEILRSEEGFLENMDLVIHHYEAQAETRLARVQIVKSTILVLTLFSIILVAVFVYRPTARALATTRERLNRTTTESEALSEELRMRTEEFERARSQAAAADRVMQEHLGNLSHELRTPMSTIVGMAPARRRHHLWRRHAVALAQPTAHPRQRLHHDHQDHRVVRRWRSRQPSQPFAGRL